MGLSNDIISQFVEITNQDKEVQNGSTVYGTIKKLNGQDYVQIDGSELMTPIKSTTYVSDGERVTVMIKGHQAIVTGNITSPAARQSDVESTVGDKIAEYDVVITEEIQAEYGKFEQLVTDNITAVNGEIENLKTENLEVKDTLIAQNGEIENLKTKKLDAETANITFATIESLKATDIEVNNIKGNFAEFSQITTDNITAVNGEIENLKAEKLNVTDADIKYANIDFANIGMAAVEELFVKSGIIKDIVVGDQHITGELVGVTIKGDLIEGNTIVAEKLVVKGSDGLYYKLNTDGMKVEAQQTEYNSLNGSIITAKSITASKVMVDDLVAFDATIGGFKITDNAIYSGVKTSVNNTTTGVYLDNTGQIAFGDSNNYIKFFRDVDNQWKLMISASSMKMSTSNKTVEEAISDINEQVQGTVKLVETYYAISDSYTVPPTTGWSKNTPTWVNGKYIWSKTKTTYIDGSSTESNPACITGAKGESGTSGSAGKGIKNITNYYLATSTNSGITISTSGWTTTIQSMSSTNKYLWNYEMITYTDNSTTKTNPVIIGVYGDKGQNGAAGEDGVGILSITEKYAVSSSNTTAPTVWYDAVQTMTSSNRYLWNYEIVKYTNNTTSETAKRVIGVYGDKGDRGLQGLQGPKGDQGIPGNDGVDGKTSYFHIKYSSVAKPTSSSQMSETPNTYIGTYVDYTAADSTDPTKYTWSRFEGLQGPKGDQGIPGTNGADGKTSYLHIKYSNDGGKTFTANNGEEPGDWIGQYTDFNVNDSTSVTAYTWSLIKGEAGVGITSVDVEYYLSTSATSLSGGEWSTTAPTWVNGKYMWSRTKTVNTTGTTTYSDPVCITGAKGSTGATGATGKGVKSTTVTYQASTSGTTVPTGSWTTTIPTVSAGQYLWTRTIITYTDDTNTTSYSIGKMGEQGATGQNGTNGVGVKSTTVTYQASTSGTTTPTGTWSSTIPTVSAGQYLWTRTVITYTNGTSATSYSIGKMGEQGPTGATGVGIKSVVNYYLASASASGVTTSTSGWTTTVQTINTTNKYLWNYEKITYTNNSTSSTDPVIIGVHGTNGTNGAAGKGISSITEYYLVSSAATGITTSTSGWTTKIPSMTTTNRYLWNYEVIKYTDNSTTTGTPKVIGVYGNTGATGATGTGISSITEEYYLSTSKTTQNGGSWTTTPPTWSSGMYIWTRSKIVYSNPTSTVYTTPICDSSWEAVNEIQIGGRNLMANSKETDTFTAFTGGTNKTMFYRTVTLPPDIKEGDKITVSLTYKYKNIVLVSGQESNAWIYVQGSGNVTGWSPGFNSSANIVPSITKGSASELTYYQTYTFTLSASQATNKTFSVGLRTDYIASGSLSVYEMKVEKGNKPTSWTPAPEDIDNSFTTLSQRVSSAELDLQKNSIIAKVQDTFTTKTESTALKNQLDQNKQNIRCNNVGAKINYSSFSTPNSGEIYLHGYDNNNNPIDANGLIYWNGTTVSVPKGMINPDGDFGTGNDVYIFMNRTNTSVVMGGYYDASAKAWKYKYLIGGTNSGTFTPVIDHVALGMFNMKDAESFNFAFLFDNPQSLKNLTVGVADLITRMNTAEQKITSDAIVNTVKNHQTNGTNTFATSSQLTQTTKNITASFKASGGYNLVKNSCFFNGLSSWTTDNIDTVGTSKSISYWTDSNQHILPNTNAVVIRGTNLTDRYGITQGVKIKRGQKYTVSALSASHRGNTIRITIRNGNGGGHLLNVTAGLSSAGKNISGWNKMEGVFTAPTDSDYITVCLYMDKSGSDGYVWFTQIMVNEGEIKQPWSPHPSEIYDGSTVIDASGVTIKNGALKVENNAGTTVLQGNTSGTLYLKDGGIVVAGTATDVWNNYGYRTTLKKNGIQFNWDASDSGSGSPPVSANVYLDYSRGQLVLSGGTKAPGIYVASGLEASSVTTPTVYTSNWFRSTGNTGWYSETYGGGWYMTDSTWIRNYGNKQVYINSLLRTDGGFHVGSGGSAFNVTTGGVVTSAGAINANGGININSGNLVLGKANTEQQICFSDCSSDNRNVYFYKGSSSSATRVGLYDKEAGSAVWRYANDNTFVLERQLIVKGHIVPHTTKAYWIGTTTPDKKWKGLCAEGGTVGASDIRNKENIERLDGTIVTYDEVSEEINEYQLVNLRSSTRANSSDYYEFIKSRFKPSYYNYKLTEHINEDTDEFLINPEDEYNMLKNVGFIAQDYDLKNDKVAQEFIFENENGELSYNHMSYVTVGMIALQEATKKIDLLENENIELKERLSKLENLVNELISK